MLAEKLYEILEKDFIKPGLTDDWAQYMQPISEFVCENFKQRSMGLVCDFTEEVSKVYTAVFPSNDVLNSILKRKDSNAMLFVHHPSIWDIRKAPEVFRLMDKNLLQRLKESKISIYNLHVPLDNFGPYSTGTALVKVVGVIPEKPFAPYCGGLAGVFGKAGADSVQELKSIFEKAIGHKASIYNYGSEKIRERKVAVIAGGGNSPELLEEIAAEGVNTFVTGITAKNSHSQKAHDFDKEHSINVLGGTHYSTEKFACIAMCDYFKKLGLPSEFIPDKPVMEDL